MGGHLIQFNKKGDSEKKDTEQEMKHYDYIGLFFCADWCPNSHIWAEILTSLKDENKNYEDLHTKYFFQFIIVPMSENEKEMEKLSAKSGAPMANF